MSVKELHENKFFMIYYEYLIYVPILYVFLGSCKISWAKQDPAWKNFKTP